MTTRYPGAIDGYSNIRTVRDGVDELLAEDHNSVRSAVLAIEQTLGVNPQSVYGTVGAWIQHLNDLYDVGIPPSGPAGGDLSGTYPDPSVVGLQGHAVSSTAPTASYVLAWSGLEWVPSPSSSPGGHLLGGVSHLADTLANLNLKVSDANLISDITAAGGDLSGVYPNPVVAQIEGYGVSPSQPTDGYGLTWNDGASQWESNKPIPGGFAGGDLRGFYPNPGVSGLQGRDVSSAAPTDGYGLTWNDGASQWESNKPIPGGVAAGDLSGTYPKPVVAKIQTRDVEAGAPTDGYGLTWNDGASQWESNKPIPGGPGGGDLRGFYPNPGVSGLQGRDVSSAVPNDSDVLTWNNGLSQWEPASTGIPAAHALGGSSHSSDTLANLNLKISDADLISDITTAGGDLNGTYPNPIVDRQRGFYTYLDDYGSLSAAVVAIGANHKGLFINTNATVSADLIIPSNISLLTYESGGLVSIDSGKELTINSPFNAGLYQIFTGDGNVVFGHGVVNEVYPQWWGGRADGITNDQPAIQKALDSLPDLPPTLTADSDPPTDEYGGIVKLSKGIWKVTSPIQMGSYQWLVGSGAPTVIENMTDSTPAIRVGDGTDYAYRVHIRDLTIRGSGSAYVAGGYGIHMKRGMRCYIGPIWIWKTTDSGIYVQGAGYTWIQDSYIQYCKKYGIYTTNNIPDANYWLTSVTISGCTIRMCQYAGIKMDGTAPQTAGQACWILNNIIESNSLNAAVELVGPAGAQTAEGYCMGIYANGITDSIIENNYFEQGAYGWIAPRVQVHIVLSGGYGNRIVKNWFLGNVGLFFWSNGSRVNYLNFIEGNTFASTATAGLLTANGSSSGFTGNNWYTNNTCMNWKDAGWYNPGTYGHNLTYNLKSNMVTTQGYIDGMRGRVQTYTHTSGSYSPNYRTITTDDSTESYGVDIGSRRGSTILITLQADISITAPINWTEGSTYTFMFVQDGTGDRNVTFDPSYFDAKFLNFGNSANNTSVVSFIACYPIWKQFGAQIPWDGEIALASATGTASIFSDQLDNASAVAIRFGSANSFVTPGSKLLSISNGDSAGLERMSVDYGGNLICNQGDNSQGFGIKYLSELTVISADIDGYSVMQIPANSIVVAVSVRVVVAIPTASTFSVGVVGDTVRYASGLLTNAGTTSPGTLDALRYYSVATAILFKPDITPVADTGRVRTTIHYIEIIPPIS